MDSTYAIDAWKTPSRKALLRAPQPKLSTPLVPPPSLSAPQRKKATSTLPLSAPQPFSNAPEADIDGTERIFMRTTSITSSHRRDSGKSNKHSKRRISRRIRPYRQRSNASMRTTGINASSTNIMEPENDVGAQPLKGNIVRKPSICVSRAEALNLPYASVAPIGSNSTAQTTEDSFEQSVASNSDPRHYSNQEMMTRQISYPKKYPPVSRASITSFTGNVRSYSRIRSTPSMDEEERRNTKRGRIPPARMSTATAEARMSSASFSMEMEYPGSREVSGELSIGIVANVVDEAQLEAEFAERMKVRMVETVEIRPSFTNEEDPQISNSYSYTNDHRRISSIESIENGHSSNKSSSSSSNHESSHHGNAPERNVSGSGTEENPQEKASTSISRCLQQRRRTLRRIVVWSGFFVVCVILIVVVVLFLRVCTSCKRRA